MLIADRLREMTADEAAAYFVTHRDDELTEAEHRLLASWLSADANHAQALGRAEAAWHCFDQTADDEILARMRAHSRQSVLCR
jgi:ferric-dicitrate binding protein FerR (iron transport regulator)